MPFENDPSTPLVDQYRAWAEAQGHNLAGRTNRELTKHIGDQYRAQGYSTSQIGELYGNDFKHAYLDIENAPEPGREGALGMAKDLGAGLERGTAGRIGTMYGAGGLAADFAGLGFAEDALMDKAAEWGDAAAEGGPSIQRASDVRWDRPAEVARFLAGGFGEAAPSVAEAVGSFYLGGGLGYQAAKQGVKKRLKETVSKTIRNRVEREAPEALAEVFAKAGRKGFQTGSSVGIGLSSFGMNMGEIYNELHPYSQLDPSHPDYVSPDDARNLSITYGGYAGSLDFASAGAMLNKILRIGNKPAETFLRRLAQNLPAGVFVEGTTEAAQEFLALAAEKYAKGEVLELSDEELDRMFDAGVLGSLGGGQFAMFGSVRGPKRERVEEAAPVTSIEPETPLLERQKDLEELLAETPGELKGMGIEVGMDVEQAIGVKGKVKSIQGDRVELEIEGQPNMWVPADTLGPEVRTSEELAETIEELKDASAAGDPSAEIQTAKSIAVQNRSEEEEERKRKEKE
ncbi:MAG: hypothetical protein MK125_13720, partial [Dehalococcoidia bacterium]|nr:hypothetical protein [Dehalococcoidia bacterium]